MGKKWKKNPMEHIETLHEVVFRNPVVYGLPNKAFSISLTNNLA